MRKTNGILNLRLKLTSVEMELAVNVINVIACKINLGR